VAKLPSRTRERYGRLSDALPFGGLWYSSASDAIDYAKFYKPFT
jgi:hypothetical protein